VNRVIEGKVDMILSEVVDIPEKVNWMKVLEVEEAMAEVLDKLAEADWLPVEDLDLSSMTELVGALAKVDI
jgi:hypothetical protein